MNNTPKQSFEEIYTEWELKQNLTPQCHDTNT